MARTLLGLVCLSLGFQAVSVSAKCYYPDGSTANDTPCSDDLENSACCGTGYECYGTASQFYLCVSTGDELQKNGSSTYVRGSCTDQTWRSSNCPSVCVDEDVDNVTGGNGVAQCPDSDTEFYCLSYGSGVENCTTGDNLIDFAATPTALTTIGVAASTSSSVASSSTSSSSSSSSTTTTATTATTTATGTTSGAATATATSTSTSSSSSSSNKVAIGVGVGVGVAGGLALIALAFFLLRRRRNKRRADAANAASAAGGTPPHPHMMDKAPAGYAPTPNPGSPAPGYYNTTPSTVAGTLVPPSTTSPVPPSELYDSPLPSKSTPVPQQHGAAAISEMPSTQVEQRYEMA